MVGGSRVETRYKRRELRGSSVYRRTENVVDFNMSILS